MRSSRWFVLSALLLSGTAPLNAQSPDRATLVARIDSIAEAALATKRAPGVSIAVVRGTDTLVLRGYGFADLEHKVPVNDRTIFRIGSLTKQFTSAAVMKLVEQRKIRLDATIRDYLPDYPGPGASVTIHQLLNHTSGIPSYTDLGDRFWTKSRLDLSHAEMLDLFAGDSLEFRPGTSWKYNNSGYYVLGMILERVTGQPYSALVQQSQFSPLGLTQTSYCDDVRIVENRARGYGVTSEGMVNADPISMTSPYSAGALCSTARDLVHWNHALVNGEVVTRASFEKMIAPTTITGGPTQPYGYGLATGELGGHRMVAHSGGINGFSAFMAHYPAGGTTREPVTIVVLANGPLNTGALQTQIARAVFNIPAPEMVPEVPLTAEQRALYTGTFDLAPALPMQVRVFVQDNVLMAQASAPGQNAFALKHVGNHTFDGPAGIRLVFGVEGGTATSVIVHQGGGTTTGKRISS